MSDIIRYEEIVGLLKDMGVLSAKILSKRVLIGLRKIGKTKLLETLADYGDSIINEYGGRNRYHFIYVDLARYLTIEKIQSHIMDQIKLKINIQSEYGKNPIHEIVKNVNISWIASVSALDKTAYVNRLRSDGSQYAAAVSAILDRAGGFRINQLCKSDVEKLLHNLFQNYSILEDTAVVDKLYHDIGGLPYFLEKAVEFIDSYDKTWDEIRESFRETIRDDFFRYYFSEQGVLHTTDSFKLILQEGVDRSTGRISDKYLTLFIERGLCAPEEVAVPGQIKNVFIRS